MEQYTTVQGDTWDIIAKKVYGNEKYAGYLMENNRLLLEYMIFPGGITLDIPELTEETDPDLPIWRD
jgi:phage tail protein X